MTWMHQVYNAYSGAKSLLPPYGHGCERINSFSSLEEFLRFDKRLRKQKIKEYVLHYCDGRLYIWKIGKEDKYR